MPAPRKKPAAQPSTPTLSNEEKEAARKEAAAANGTPANPVVVAIQARMTEIQTAQQPTRDQIAALQASLSDGAAELDRLQTALDAINGKVPTAAPARVTARRSTSGMSTEERQAAAAAFVNASGAEGVTGKAVADHLGVSPATIAKDLTELVDSGKIKHNGKKQRGSRFQPA